MGSRFLRSGVLFCVSFFSVSAISTAQTETGKFKLHKFEQPIGEETYTIFRSVERLEMQDNFLFADRGTKVPLNASFQGAPSDYTPQSFVIKGKSSRFSTLDAQVSISGKSADVREGKESRTLPAPAQFFTIDGYSPTAMQMMMLRYWRAHGSPARVALLPSGEAQITDRGSEVIHISGNAVSFERYSVKGLVWGIETLWMDHSNNLAALVTRDAEFDHFEAVREEYEEALPQFVTAAAKDEMAELEELGRHLPGRRTGDFAFVGATLIDGTGAAPVPDAVVVTHGGRIVAAGPASNVTIPNGAAQIDVKGKFIIPGLWEMHAHYEQVEWGSIYLAAGVTTARDVGNEFEFITAVRDKLNSGQGLGPRLLLAGIVDGDGPIALGVQRVNSPEDAVKWVNKYHEAGFQQIKIYSSMKLDNVKATCAEAHRLGMTVTGHIPEGMDIYDGVNAGMDQVNHVGYVMQPLFPKGFSFAKATPEERRQARMQIDIHSEAGQKLVAFLKAHGTVLDDTVAITEWAMHPGTEPYTKWEPGAAKVAPPLRDQLMNSGSNESEAVFDKEFHQVLEILGTLHSAGVPIVAGTDQTVPGYSVYREIELYVQAGFTPMEALQAATLVPAKAMKIDSESGTIGAGKRADFDILDRNPLEDIHNIRSVRSVVANGVLYDTAPLWKAVGFEP